jgi:hypothetical protein
MVGSRGSNWRGTRQAGKLGNKQFEFAGELVSMRYAMPHFPCEFEIPDDWIAEAGAQDFSPNTAAYGASAKACDTPLTEVEPPPRLAHVRLSWRGLDRDRFVRVLTWIVLAVPIEAVPVAEMPFVDFGSSPYRFRVRDGVHRFYASIAAGFTHLPLDRDL